jgi:hypothetical protein
MKLQNNENQEQKKEDVVQTQQANEIYGLKDFSNLYPNNQTVPLVFFDKGMKKVDSPFTFIAAMSKAIEMEDKQLIQKLRQEKKYNELTMLQIERRNSIIKQLKSRIEFLSRSLALNLQTDYILIINNKFDSNFEASNSIMLLTTKMLTDEFNILLFNPYLLSMEDMVVTYTINTTTIPVLITSIYDLYDSEIIDLIRYKGKNGSFEKLHLDILMELVPLFEKFKSQLERKSYMLRYEISNVYNIMSMYDANEVIIKNNLDNNSNIKVK